MRSDAFGAWIIAAAALALPANADIMHWYWQVEVNSQPADASKPIVVGAGDEVEIELWAEWSPQGAGFAWSWFSIATGDAFFEASSEVNISESSGYGRNPSLSVLSSTNGTFTDTDGSGTADQIDWIDVGQLSRRFGHFDDSHPMLIYSFAWVLGESINVPVVIERTDVFLRDTDRFQIVYTDDLGNQSEYDHIEESLIFVPAPSSVLALMCVVLLRNRTR